MHVKMKDIDKNLHQQTTSTRIQSNPCAYFYQIYLMFILIMCIWNNKLRYKIHTNRQRKHIKYNHRKTKHNNVRCMVIHPHILAKHSLVALLVAWINFNPRMEK